MAEMVEAVEERLSLDEKLSVDYESHIAEEGDQTPEDWRRMYRAFLWTDADVRARFERAEYFLLYNKEFGESLTAAHVRSKYKLWALRQQMYEGNCTVKKPGVLEQYRYPELVLKRKAWIRETNKPPRQCAIEFEAKIRSLDPDYMHWNGYPSGPLQQVKAALRLQTSFRSWTSAGDMLRQKRIKAQIGKLRNVARTVLHKQESKASLVRIYKGFNAFEEDEDTYSEPFTTIDRARATCMERKCGGFVVSEGRAFFRPQTPWAINKDKHRYRADHELYVIQDTEMEKQAKINELWASLQGGKIVLKYTFNGKRNQRTMWLDKDVYRICIGTQGAGKSSEKAKGLYITDVCEVRQGPRTMTFANYEGTISSPKACMSLVGSERTVDVEFKDAQDCDWFAERFNLLMDQINDEKTRYRMYERHLLTQTGWRKPLSFSEAVDMKLAQDELVGGIMVLKYNQKGATRPGWLALDQALLKDLSLGEEQRRPRLVLGKEPGVLPPDSKGIDLADIAEIRPGIRSHNFDAAKGSKDLKKIENLCVSIIGSERTLSLELMEGSPDQLERIVKGLRLLVFGCPRLLGNLERDDQDVGDISYHGKPWVSSTRNECKLIPKFERDEEELATAEAVSSATMQTMGSDADDTLSEEQTTAYTKAFKMFDKDGSNSIDASELHKAMHSLGKRISPQEAERMLAEYDVDGDMEIGVDEFLKMMARADSVQDSLAGIGEVFQVFDEDGDGYVTHDEFRQVLVSYNDGLSEMLTAEQISRLIEMIDTDGDGQIDHGEFTSFLIATMTD